MLLRATPDCFLKPVCPAGTRHCVPGKSSSGSTHVTLIVPEHISHLGLLVCPSLLPTEPVLHHPPSSCSSCGLRHPPLPHQCSGAQLAPVPSSLGNEPEGFTGVSVGNEAKGIWALSMRGDEHISHQSLSEGFFSLVSQPQLETLPPEPLLPAVYHLYC